MTTTDRAWWHAAVPGVVVGLVSAGIGLDRKALWLDEAYTLGAIHQLGSALRDTSGTMGLYYVVLRGWTAPSESVLWMRGLSLLFGLAAIVVVVRLATRLGDRRFAAAAGLVLALSPMWFSYAREARSYALVLLLVSVSWLALDHGMADVDGRCRRRWWLVHTVVALLLPLAHGLAVLQLVPQVGVVALGPRSRSARVGVVRGLVAATFVTGLLLVAGARSVGDWVSPLSAEQAGFLVGRFTSSVALLGVVLSIVVVAGALVGGRDAVRAESARARARALLPLAWGLVPVLALALVSLLRPSFIPRYAVGSAPGVALLMVIAVRQFGRWRSAAGYGLLALIVVALLVGRIEVERAPEDGWTMAATVVADGARPGDTLLLAVEPTTRPAFEAAWRDVDRPDEPVALVAADRPLGRVLRFEPDQTPSDVRWAEARGADRLWVVGDERRLELDRLRWLVDGWAGRPPSHREVDRWETDEPGVVVVLLEPVA